MEKDRNSGGLLAVLDYILNTATIREIDALEAAVERRRKDLTAQSGIISLDPSKAARKMTEAVNASISASMDGIRSTFRDFAVDLVRREAPELTEAQMNELVESWIPPSSSSSASSRPAFSAERAYRGLSKKGLINGIPRDVLHEMVSQFVAYSTGTMSLSDESALREAVGDWTTVYWKKFPSEIQQLIRDYLQGELSRSGFEDMLVNLLQ